MTASDVLDLIHSIHAEVWLTGGWGIDALLGEHTRTHKDVDLLVHLKDVVRVRRLLESAGYGLKEIWSEDKVVVDPSGMETSTAFVMAHPDGREVDLHAIVLDAEGNGVPAWNHDEGWILRSADLAGQGHVAGRPVRCLSAAMQFVCHTGYDPPDYQLKDMELLRAHTASQQAEAKSSV